MTEIVIIGGGPTGLTAAMKFAGYGASVVVLERDASPMPDSAATAWTAWERRAVAQFRQIHFLQPGGRLALQANCPAVVDELWALGGVGIDGDVIFEAPVKPAEPDPRFATVNARRPVIDLAFARAASACPGVEIRRGAAVESLVTGTELVPGRPHVVGVRLDTGEVIAADLVIDASGRRSRVGEMVVAAGGPDMPASSTDVGFVYTTRYYRGALPEYRSGLLTALGSISALVVPSDNDTWGVTLYTHPQDKPFRRLRDAAVFERVVRLLPQHAHWLDGEPISEPASMTSTANTVRELFADGAPVATGLLPLGDAFAFTNPSIGRGISMGVIHAIDVADAVAPVLGEPRAIAAAWASATDARVRDFIASTLQYDLTRGPEVEAAIRGEVHEHSDPTAQVGAALEAARHRDQQVYEEWRKVATLQASIADLLGVDGLFDRIVEHGSEPWVAPQPARADLLAAVA